jgi:hypothetical protein
MLERHDQTLGGLVRRLIQQDLENILVVGEVTYRETLENFAVDYGAMMPALPEGITLRIYERDVRHPLIADNNVLDGGPMPWLEGDEIIDSVDILLATKTAREASANKKVKDMSEEELDMGKNIREIVVN